MNRIVIVSTIAATVPFFAVACGSPKPPTDVTTAPSTSAPSASAVEAPSASASVSASASAAPPPAPKPVTAADAAAACTTTATYDKKTPDKLTFSVKNTSDREVKMCWLEFYVYDKPGTQLAHVTLPYNYAIAPGASDGQSYEWHDLKKQIGGKTVASIEVVIAAARFADGGEFRDESLAPPKRPRAAKK